MGLPSVDSKIIARRHIPNFVARREWRTGALTLII
jgi:hypothetical protein